MLEAQKSITLKLSEPEIDPRDPWVDDLLARQELSVRLTNLIADQEAPLTVSLHGQWGTGKTFMLMRWQKALEADGYKAIYFNAWQDDFCGDPLLAIIGQMADYFKESKFWEMAREAAELAVPLIKASVIGVLKAITGFPLEPGQAEKDNKPFLDEYLERKDMRDELKNQLAELSAKVADDTGRPLVLIIDELDRCRPTFAIELLERVKHIFDVPHTVFVFGLNRDELCKTLSSIYGDIDTDVYLRRFFDFEFNLPEADSQTFAMYLLGKFRIHHALRELSKKSNRQHHMEDWSNCIRVLPKLWSALGLSLRDIDYGIRLLALLIRNLPLHGSTHPFLAPVLIAMKFKKPEFYRSLATGNFRTSEIMDYIDEESRRDLVDEDLSMNLDRIEGLLYCADQSDTDDAETELTQISEEPSDFRVISRRAQKADRDQRERITAGIVYGMPGIGMRIGIDRNTLGRLASLIDTYQTEVRR